MQKRTNIMRNQKYYCKLSANSLSMIKSKQFKINCIEDISIKSDAKKIKFYQVLKTFLLGLANPFAMITKQQIRINYIEEISM